MKNNYKTKSQGTAIIIGVDTYASSVVPQLRTAVSDALTMYSYLANSLNYHCHLIVNDKATKVNILYVIATVAELSNKNSNLIIYFAGHGRNMAGPSICAHDFIGSDFLNLEFILETLVKTKKTFPDILFILDCCEASCGSSIISMPVTLPKNSPTVQILAPSEIFAYGNCFTPRLINAIKKQGISKDIDKITVDTLQCEGIKLLKLEPW